MQSEAAFGIGLVLALAIGCRWTALRPQPKRSAAGLFTAACALATLWLAARLGSTAPDLAIALVAAGAMAAGAGWLLGRRALARREQAPAAARPSARPAAGARDGNRRVQADLHPQAEAKNDSIPHRLGPYAIERQVARGAMGTILAGVDPASGRLVAIKTMALAGTPASETEEAKARFFREGETVRRLHHPDIVTHYGSGEDQGFAYIAMELLQGGDLRPHCVQLLPPTQALCIAARIADALDYAHKRGVVHRDIKPSNIMIDLAQDSVKVTDFGIAHLADWSQTRTGVMLGTPGYMSPEQLLGQPLDGRTDLYSLGALLFELLTGRLPHEADSVSHLMQAIVNQPAPDVCQLRPELPEAVSHVLARALAKKPQDRYADGNAFALALRALPGVTPGDSEQP